MLSLSDEDELVQCLRDLIRIESDIEAGKTRLSHCSDFNLADAFHVFDQPSRGFITPHVLKEGLGKIGIYPTSNDIDLWVQRYDTNGDTRITKWEFEAAFLSQDPYYASLVTRRTSNYKCLYGQKRDSCFNPDTASEFRQVWSTHFKSEIAAELIRQRLRKMPYFNVYDAFSSLDLNEDGMITRDEFRRIIMSRGFSISEKEVSQIVDKMDQNKNGRISFNEFKKEILPRSPERHSKVMSKSHKNNYLRDLVLRNIKK